jgi:16S rRNA (uracil1498-N3)-methyltransferase
MPVFFIPSHQVRDGRVIVTGELLVHLRASLRVRPSEEVHLTTDTGRCYRVRVTEVTRRELRAEVVDERARPERRAPSLTLGQALLKGDRMDWVIQKATELGVGSIAPLICARGIVRPLASRTRSQQSRWQRIALEAAQQAERWDVPTLGAPCKAWDWLAGPPPSTMKLILVERGTGESLGTIALPREPGHHIVIAVGPEGGWEQEEVTQAGRGGFLAVTLGERILRSETASLAALSIIQSRLGELG